MWVHEIIYQNKTPIGYLKLTQEQWKSEKVNLKWRKKDKNEKEMELMLEDNFWDINITP